MNLMTSSNLVIVSHYNAWPTDQLISLLDQIGQIPAGLPFRCLIVVNQAVDQPLVLPDRHSGIEVLYRENTGYNIGAWEHGWRTAPRADYYLFLQEECRILRPNWLRAMVRIASKPGIGLVGERMAWPGYRWDRVAHHYSDCFYEGDAELNFTEGVLRFLQSKAIPPGPLAEHLQSLILCIRREVLEEAGGFLIGSTKGDAISCEIAFSRSVVSKGLKIQQAGLLPFHYIAHPQWMDVNPLVYGLMLRWVDRYAPFSYVRRARHAVLRLMKATSGRDWNEIHFIR